MRSETESVEGALHGAGAARFAVARLGVVALLVAGCMTETSYVPRTPNAVALGIQRNEPVLYKNGVITKVGSASAVASCSTSAAADAGAAASHHASYMSSSMIGGVCNALSVLVPPLIAPGIYFTIRAADHQQRSYVHLVDAINRHNDDSGCVQR